MSQASERVSEKIPWVLVILLSAFLGAFGTAWTSFLPSNLFSFYNLGTILCVMNLTSAPFIILIFAALFSAITKRKISSSTLTYLFVIGSTCSWYICAYYLIEWNDLIASRHMNPDWAEMYVPWFMAPPESVTSQLLGGHVAIPWGDWVPSTLYHWSVFVLFGFFFISVATVFRRQWIDVERVPFPHALVAYELVKRIPEEKKSLMEKLGRPFFLGIVLGFVFQVPVFMTNIFPWFPDIYGWKTLCWSGQWYIQASSPLAGIVGLSAFQEHPAAVAIGYLVPLSISFNAWFWHLIFIVMMQVAYVMGYYTGLESEGGCGRAWCSPSGLLEGPYKFNAVSYGGGLLGLAVISLILSRHYIVETVRAALRKGGLDTERNEALSYRSAYIMLASSFILLVALFMAGGLGIVAALLIPISFFFYWMANARLFGLAGIQARALGHGNTLFRLFVWQRAPDPPTREFVLAAYYSSRGMDSPDSIGGGSILTGFTSYRMASLTGTSNSNVLKVMLASTIITPLVVIITLITLCYTYGATVFASASGEIQTRQFYNISNPTNYNKAAGTEPLAPYVAAGFLVVALLEFLHSRFVWFPFSAIGFIIGTSYISVLWGYWGTFLIAWVLKVLTLRVGGSKLYENLGVPIAGGFVVGYMIALVLGGAMGMLRFFFPF